MYYIAKGILESFHLYYLLNDKQGQMMVANVVSAK